MRALVFSFLLTLVACDRAPTPSSPAEIAVEAAAPAPSFSGKFSATSNTAMGITGDVTIDAGQLVFSKGQTLKTTTLSTPDVTGIVGQTLYGENPPDDFTIELRRIESTISSDPAAQKICGDGDQAATYIAIVRDSDRNNWLVPFTGKTPPTSAEAVCATFLYATP
ncbi:MAG: hypothetical protein ABWZ40_10490 [Caulobacterales bacterium]